MTRHHGSPIRKAAPADTPKNTKIDILDAAALCFARSGSEQASIDDIARHLGATKGKIYHHFRSKGELLGAVRRHSVRLAIDHVEPLFRAGGTPATLFRAMARAHVEVMISALAYHQVVVEHLLSREADSNTAREGEMLAEIKGLQEHYEGLFRDVIARGAETGEFRSQNISVALHSVLMLLHAPVYWYRPRENETDADRAAIADQIADMALAALRA